MKFLKLYFYLISMISVIVLMFVFEEERNIKTFKDVISKRLYM